MTIPNAYTLDDILALRPCDPDQRRALFADVRTLTAREALARGTTVRDLLWVAGKMGRKVDCVRFAIACARAVAHLNTDPRVMAAIDAAQAWVDAPNADAADAAAYAAAAAAAAGLDTKAIFLAIFEGPTP